MGLAMRRFKSAGLSECRCVGPWETGCTNCGCRWRKKTGKPNCCFASRTKRLSGSTFFKTTQKTPRGELDLAKQRMRAMLR